MISILHILATTTVSSSEVNAPGVGLTNLPRIVTETIGTIAGGLSVIFVIVGALKYTTSAGDPKKVSSAKETILYALIGVVITILAFAIASFVLTSLGSGSVVTGS